jgi:hypothetical protein
MLKNTQKLSLFLFILNHSYQLPYYYIFIIYHGNIHEGT